MSEGFPIRTTGEKAYYSVYSVGRPLIQYSEGYIDDGGGAGGTERLGTCHICLSFSEAGEQVQGHERGHHQRPQLQGDYKVHVKTYFFPAFKARTNAEISITVLYVYLCGAWF